MITWSHQLAEWVRTACLMEVMCPKPGNVSPGREFIQLKTVDFIRSADAIASVLGEAPRHAVGTTVLRSIQATRRVVSSNTNLGIVLLLSPLAAVRQELSLAEGIHHVLQGLTVQDSVDVYHAIELAEAAGMGEVPDQDVRTVPTADLRSCMVLAADRDLIALQYANGFQQVLQNGLAWLQQASQLSESQVVRIQWTALQFMAEFGDSLIARKCGAEMSDQVRCMARQILDTGWPAGTSATSHEAIRPGRSLSGPQVLYEQLDAFLRADGNRRNPGTTADLIAAVLFAALREGQLSPEGDWWKPPPQNTLES